MGLMRKALEKRSRRICANLYLSLKMKKGQWWQISKEVRIEMEEAGHVKISFYGSQELMVVEK